MNASSLESQVSEESNDSESDDISIENEEQEIFSDYTVDQLPNFMIPAWYFLEGKEIIFGIPPISALPKRYQVAQNNDKFTLEDYVTDCLCALCPEEIFHNRPARHVLARIAARLFMKNRHVFSNKAKGNTSKFEFN